MAQKSLIPDLPLFRDEADKAIRIFNRLRVPDVIGTPTMATAAGAWFRPIVAAIFGSYDVEAQRRLLQEFFILVPKKNGKTSYSAAIMVVAVIMNRRPEAEFLLIAPTKEVADIAYRQATGIIRLDEELIKLFHVQRNLRMITHRETNARIQIKAADTDVITGSKATGILVDETHVFAKRSNADEVFIEIRGALAARPDGFMIQISTQSKTAPVGVFASELETARAVRDGKLHLPLLPVLYELPERVAREGGWKDKRNWPLVNPNLGRSVDAAFLERELLKAERDGLSQLALFASQHFNVQIGKSLSVDGWAGAQFWDRGYEPGLTLERLLERSEVATVGVDGGGLDDLLGIAVVGRDRESKRWLAWTHALISPEGLDRRKANRVYYDKFQEDGDLTVVERLPEDLTKVVELVGRVKDADLLAQVGVDKVGIGGIVDALADIGVTQEAEMLGAVPQGIALMGAFKAIERKLVDGSFAHGGTALMRWCVDNARVVPTPTAVRIARDEGGYGKIDPLMALFDAAYLMSLNPQAKAKPKYQAYVF